MEAVGIMSAVDACFHRFGVLASLAGTAEVMNDQGSIQDDPQATEDRHNARLGNATCTSSTPVNTALSDKPPLSLHKECMYSLNRICVRRFTSTFMIMYRHLQLYDTTFRLEGEKEYQHSMHAKIKTHHMIAAADDYAKLSMHWDLMPAAKLNYMHDFPGVATEQCIREVKLLQCDKLDG